MANAFLVAQIRRRRSGEAKSRNKWRRNNRIMVINTLKECKSYIRDDAYRYIGTYSKTKRLKLYLTTIGFRYTFWMRIGSYLRAKNVTLPFYLIARWRLRHLSYKSGIQIPDATQIGKGFYIGHFGTIIINGKAVLGKNINISQDVTIGQANRGNKKGTAIIGNEVYIGPGAKIVGEVKIGNNVAIGANAVVTKDVPDNSCVAGVPARVISDKGADGYVNRKV